MAESSEPSPAPETEAAPRKLQLSRMQVAVGRQMAISKQTVPHFYVATDVEMDRVVDVARELSGRPGAPRISVTACLVHALAATLLEHPAFNATLGPDGYVIADSVNVGVAIALDQGLVAPALLDCGRMDLAATAAALDDLVARTRRGSLRAAEMSSATFTLSNLGMFDVDAFQAIVIPPQVAILATGRSVRRPVVVEGEVVVRSVMRATLSADHRAVDGAQAARFLGSLKARLESFA